MKKSIIALFAAASMVAGVSAQDKAGEDDAFGIGTLSGGEIATAAVVLGVGAAIISNNRGSSKNPDPEPPTELTCNEGDVLVDDVCVGTTNTVTVSASQTVTQTITVPVTFTYAPFVQ